MRRAIPGGVRRSPWFKSGIAGLWLWCAGAAWAQGEAARVEGAPAPTAAPTSAPEPTPLPEPAPAPAPTPTPAPAPSAASSAIVVRASSEGFSLASEDKAFQIKLRGYLQ